MEIIRKILAELHRFFSPADIPALWHSRLKFYSQHRRNSSNYSNNSYSDESVVTQPSKFGSFVYSSDHEKHSKLPTKKLICYYTTPRFSGPKRKFTLSQSTLKIKNINPDLCTHLNIGIIDISNCSLVIDDDLIAAFKDSNVLKGKNENLKVLLWVGGADESMGFSDMVSTHDNRKRFIQSLKATLEKYALDGVGELWWCPPVPQFLLKFNFRQTWIGNFPTDPTPSGFTSCNCCTRSAASTSASTARTCCRWPLRRRRPSSKCATTSASSTRTSTS